jgi:hypothetical protein
MENLNNSNGNTQMNRRDLLKSGLALAGVALLPNISSAFEAPNRTVAPDLKNSTASVPGRRKLGKLEVSSIGLGVQNMSRTYQTTIPTRTEMHNIIRTAFDKGVTFFDAAEAYGPHEVERILGEGIAPIRNKVVITSKFGWNIDLETGKRMPGLNSGPNTS